MNDFERAKAKRARELELAADHKVREMACLAIAALPLATPECHCTALALAVIAIADRVDVEREALIEAFSAIARSVPKTELVGS